jgi:O-antigen/teichoic acid export membrane protein
VLAPWLLTIWISAEFATQSATALRIISVGLLFNSLAFVPYSLLQAVGRPDLPAKLHLVEAVPTFVLAVVLIERWGAPGAAASWAIRAAADMALLYVAARAVERARLAVGRVDVRAVVIATGIVLIGALMSALDLVPAAQAIIGTAMVAVYLLVSASWVLDASERASMRLWLARFWPQRAQGSA